MKFGAWCMIGILVALAILVPEGWAQEESCVNQLIPCLNYLNGMGEPPDNCCNPLKSVIKSNPECLCSMISIKGTNEAEKAGINVTEAQQLPGRCGQHVNPISCLTVTGSPDSKNSVPHSESFSLSSPNMRISAAVSIIIQVLFQVVDI
ncbi:non-specific lipid transfer protein GPI-anchored 30 [Cornus florida]|uniref:non-specific lipid transfer protein GPI-anchored 30 n=1 Tax=Cornus florida TaxID=4283 RepID=UPI0028981C61|nr:non-specific lipid transfer protein GPI-anchored 30 [Cornus florida]